MLGTMRRGQGQKIIKGHCSPTEQQVPGRRPVKAQHCSLASSEAAGVAGRWEGLALQVAGLGFILRMLWLLEGVRQAMVGRGGRDTSLACEGGLGGVMSQLSKEAVPGPRLYPQHRLSEQVFSGEMI